MEDNYTVTIQEELFPRLMVTFGIYFGAGVCAFVANSLFFASIYKHPLLRERKEYVILSALVLMDLLQGYAFTTSGIGRMYYIWSGTANHLVTRIGCLAKTWNWVWFTVNEAYAATLLMVSADRLLSMGFPLRYLQWRGGYTFAIIAVFHAPYVPVVLYATYEAQKDDDRAYLSQICYSTMVYRDISLNNLLQKIRSNLALASFVAYIAVVMVYHLRTKRVLKTMSSSTQRNRLDSQRRLMVTLGLSCAATMLLYVSPSLILSAVSVNSFVYSLVGPCLSLNIMMNALLFFWRHKTIRKAIYCLLTNKILTQNMIDEISQKANKVSPSERDGPRASHKVKSIEPRGT